MITRTHRTTSSFTRAFRLRGVDHVLSPGTYEVVTEEELIEGLSFPVYRRVSTIMLVPGESACTLEMVAIDPTDLAAAQDLDRTAPAREAVMSLIRYHEHFRFERHEGVYFWMADGATPFLCKVSHEALRDRSVRDGANASLPDTFVRHRERIETIAGEKYALRRRPNDIIMVLTRDLAPQPM